MVRPASDIAFTDTVKALQAEHGSRDAYARMETGPGWQTLVTPELRAFLSGLDMFYLATANASGQPYIQYRGGSPGFLKVIDESTLGFADFAGNRQFISTGNLRENSKAFLFFMDYAQAQRIKVWGRARIVEGDPELLARLADPEYPGRPERATLFDIEAWDINCPTHIHRRVPLAEVEDVVQSLRTRIQELEAQLKEQAPPTG